MHPWLVTQEIMHHSTFYYVDEEVDKLKEKMRVMLTTEGTYPFHQGGVSTWCDQIVQGTDKVDYTIYSVMMNPFVTQKFKLPESATLVKMPLWGTEEPSEHFDQPFSQSFLAKKRTTSTNIDKDFIPLFETLVQEIIQQEKNPKVLSKVLLDLHLYFQYYEYKKSFKSEETWNTYKTIILSHVQKRGSDLARPDVYSLIQSLGWLYRFLNILNTPIPDVHLTHSSAAGFCGIPCVLSKLKNKTPYMLTEHGVYLREQYLSLSKREYSSFLNTFLMRMVHSITSLNYYYADQVSPVCEYNTRWELEFGVPQERIKVLYNGVDPNVFLNAPSTKASRPTIVTVARIDPIKDIEMLIKASKIVREQIADVQFVIYGSVTVPDYYEECLKLREKLGLEETVIFAGHSSNIAAAYKSGDLVALTSISEAFPYSVVEAMMAGTAVIATDVGGIGEALGNCGKLVPARNHEKLAEEIVRLMRTPELRASMAEEGRERALSMFTVDRVLREHLESYWKLIHDSESLVKSIESEVAASQDDISAYATEQGAQRIYASTEDIGKQINWMERGMALKFAGYYEEALFCYRHAIVAEPSSQIVPVLLLETAEIYNYLGRYELAFLELEKHHIFNEALIS